MQDMKAYLAQLAEVPLFNKHFSRVAFSKAAGETTFSVPAMLGTSVRF